MLSDDDLGLLSEGENSEGEGDGICALSGNLRVDPGDEVDLGRAVTTKTATEGCCPSASAAVTTEIATGGCCPSASTAVTTEIATGECCPSASAAVTI